MEYVIEVDEDRGLCRARVSGRMDAEEYEPAMNVLIQTLAANPDLPVLYDLRAADLTHVTVPEMSALRYANERLAENRGHARFAVLVGDDLHYGIIRMYEALGVTPNLELRLFRDESEATDWLLQSPLADTP